MNIHLKKTLSIIEMLVGTALTAAAFGLIMIPQNFAAGGVTGFARWLSAMVPIPLSGMVLIVNMAFLLLGLLVIGKAFAVKTVVLSLLFPAMLEFFSHYPIEALRSDAMLSSLTAAVMLGVGVGLTLRSGASTGGFAVVAVVLNKKYRFPVGTVLNVCDCAVILMQAVGQPLINMLYGILTATAASFVVNYIVALDMREIRRAVLAE